MQVAVSALSRYTGLIAASDGKATEFESGHRTFRESKPMNSDCSRFQRQFGAIAELEVSCDVTIAEHTSYRIGGVSRYWLKPRTEKAVGLALHQIDQAEIPLVVLGGGSNVLVSDRGWQGVVLHIEANLSGWKREGMRVSVLAGTRLMDLVAWTVSQGLRGLESMAGIPGTVGGALRMNAGAFGQEIEKVTVSVSGFHRNGNPVWFSRRDIAFGYRTAPELSDVIITSAILQFQDTPAASLESRMADILARRAAKQPLEYPSCGSVFKRPAGDYAGRLIEAAGLKGTRIGDAMISPKHAGFIVNLGDATADDVYQLICQIRSKVADRFGVMLEPEVKLIGSFDPLEQAGCPDSALP